MALSACVVRTSFGSPYRLLLPRAVCRPRSRPWRRLETLEALLSSPNKPTRRGVTTRSPPSATAPRRRAGSTRRPRRSKPRRTSAARAQRRVFYGAAINPTARRQRGGLLPALPVRLELHVRHGAPRVVFPALRSLTCVCDPQRLCEDSSEEYGGPRFSAGFSHEAWHPCLGIQASGM